MSPLNVYRASAGSGKTFRLTYEYLKLLFSNPDNYRQILAVTFTNKAASEMKSRILERLYHLSVGSDENISADAIMLMAETGLGPVELAEKAKDLLSRILNDYSHFSVGTIDRFFQGVIRAFAREIGLQAGFSLELDRDRVLSEAVDRMFMDITEDKEIRDWLLRFAETRIENDKGWNFRNDILNLSKDLFLESYQSLRMESGVEIGKQMLMDFMKELEGIIASSEKIIREIAGEALREINNSGLEVLSFVQKSRGIPAFFENVYNGGKYFLTPGQVLAMTDLGKWVTVNEIGSSKADVVARQLQPRLVDIFNQTLIIRTAQNISPYMYTMGILNDLSDRILDITSEKNMFMLNDSSRFLRGLIGDNPTPFIYEKTGSAFNHLMLDEFQDTSVFQWDNFKPLLNHTLSVNNENLIVGDVKQSIYRWRNSDWKILADEVVKSFPGQEIITRSISENWRSHENIILFNNTLFSTLPDLVRAEVMNEMDTPGISEDFRNKWNSLLGIAYSDVVQEIPVKSAGTGGYVKGYLAHEEEDSFANEMMVELPGWIMNLQDHGYQARDIAILVRYNSEGAQVAQSLMDFDRENNVMGKYCFDFVSNESLFLDKNLSVRFIISVLSYMDNPNDMLNILHVKYYYIQLRRDENSHLDEILPPAKDIREVLPGEFIDSIPILSRLPLFELIEELINRFNLDNIESDLPYIQAFQNIIIEIQREEQGNIHDFLSYWEEFGSRKSLTISDGQDAIQIMTIHKAKGLQFKAVLIPFCNWELTTDPRRDTILWCNTRNTPFASIPLVPVKYKGDLKDTLFAANYLEEMTMGYVDSLNLLYVALTRAEEALFVGMPAYDPDKKITKSGQMVMQAVKGTNSPIENCIDFANILTDTGFEFGNLSVRTDSERMPANQWMLESYPVNMRADKLNLKMKSNDYFLSAEDQTGDHINFGNLMHELFGLIKSERDVDSAIEKFRRDGLIKREQANRLKDMVLSKISGESVRSWFYDKHIVENERTIMVPGMESYRPDRVMTSRNRTVVVDYKFGELEERRHEMQVTKYMELLSDMGYANIEGYIWYVMSDKLVKVN